MNLVDEVLEHLLRVGEVGDDAILHRAHGVDVPRGATEHALGFRANGHNDLATARGLILNGDDRGFVEYDALVAHVDQGICSTQVDRQITGKVTAKTFEHEKKPAFEASGRSLP